MPGCDAIKIGLRQAARVMPKLMFVRMFDVVHEIGAGKAQRLRKLLRVLAVLQQTERTTLMVGPMHDAIGG